MQGLVSNSWQRSICNLVRGFAYLLTAVISTTPAFGANAIVEQKIHRIEDGLLPPVFVSGEAPPKMKLADRMAVLQVPGVSVAVIHDGKIEWARGFGVTKVGDSPVSAETLFQAASISKPVTALAILRLVQEGKLNLDTDVNQYLKNWKVPANNFTDQQKVALRRLLTHTAGVTVHGFAGYSSTASVPTLLQVLNGELPANSPAIRVDTQPGASWRYSGGGYVIAQQLLEDVTGKPFEKFMQESVLSPIGMKRSSFEQPLPKSRLTEVAIPYRSNGKPVKGGPHIYPEKAAAGLWTTPSDLAQYAVEIQRALDGKSGRVIGRAMAREMLTPGLENFGLGLHIGGKAPQLYFDHDGGNDGYRCYFVMYHGGDGAVIMTNGDNGGRLIAEILRTIAYEYNWPDFQPPTRRIAKIEPERFDLLSGSYQLSTSFVLTFTREGERFISQATNQRPVELFAENEREYFTKDFDSRVTFMVDDLGRGTEIVFHQNGRDRLGKRLDESTEKSIVDGLAAINKRHREQVAQSGSEEALSRLIGELAAARPDYAGMAPALAELTRQQLPKLHASITQLGTLVSVKFKSVDVAGNNIYDAVHEQGAAEWRILLSTEGKIERAGFQVER